MKPQPQRLLAAAALLAACSALQAAELGDAAPALKISEWVKGKEQKLADGKGRQYFVVEFWATWCPPCRVSIPHLTDMQKKFKENVTFIGVSGEEPATVKPFVTKMGAQMDYVVALDKDNGTSKGYMEAFGVEGIPHAFIVDKAGIIAWHGHPMAGLDKALEQMLAGKYDIAAARRAQLAAKLINQYAQFVVTGREADRAAKLGEQIVRDAGNDAQLMNEFAWFILTEEGVKNRNLALAMRAAKAAFDACDGKDPAIVDTYARALFDTGKKADAIKFQKQAIAMCKDATLKPELEKTLREYEEKSK